ncbi:unnamed protein product [Closterium sp. Naga37s-1]|nr:unnamed protein product [Closterium sp. Naga37s-1]
MSSRIPAKSTHPPHIPERAVLGNVTRTLLSRLSSIFLRQKQATACGYQHGEEAAGAGQTGWKAAEEPGNEVQNDAIVAPPQEQAEHTERALQLFDMDMAFGPCTGLSRLERWQRANRLGLNPPPHVRALLESASCREDSVWEGRV